MLAMGPILLLLGCFVFVVGTVVGSFLNVCIYRIPWEKSVIWPGSRCPRCWSPISATDNIPIVSWLALRGECRQCGEPISPRYPLIELLVGLLFLGLYYVDVVLGERGRYGYEIGQPLATLAYHAILVALLVVATFIDYDLFVIPDAITVTGVILGIGLGALNPLIRPEPAAATTHAQGLWVGILGLLVGAGVTQSRPGRRNEGVRARGHGVWRRHAHGHDRCLSGLASGHPQLLRGGLLRAGACALEIVGLPQEMGAGREIIDRRSRTPFWTLPEHGSARLGPVLALAVE